MKICLDCGLSREAHHEFRERVVPAGCQCAPGDWRDRIPPACDAYVPLYMLRGPEDDNPICMTCEHDKACHKVTP